jgi:RNA 2',3'-cyclic 3'-phosphodiesterase
VCRSERRVQPILPVMPKEKRRFKKERPPDPDSPEAGWRLFIAVPMPPAAIDLVDRAVAELSKSDLPVRWVAPDTAHLTLHFLGDTAAERAELLRMALAQVVARHRTIALKTGGLGVFPDERHPRVIWLGLSGQSERLIALHRDLGDALRALDLPVEERILRPHITLGRVRDNPSSGFPVALKRRLDDPALRTLVARSAVEVPVTEVQLVRSFLGRSGARHEPIARYPLASTEV